MKVVVDLNRCHGYGQCVFAAPHVFHMEGQAALFFDYAPSDAQNDAVVAAAAACPMHAILLERAEDAADGFDAESFTKVPK